jgi:uncharacterized protein
VPLTTKSPASYLEENLATFTSLLRSEGLPIGTTEMIDAFTALSKIDLASRAEFKVALQATLVKSRADRLIFSRLFDLFFVPAEEHCQRAVHADGERLAMAEKMEQANRELQFKGEALALTPGELQQYGSLSTDQQERLQDFLYKTETGVNVEPRFKPLLETVVKSHLRYCRSRERMQSSQAACGAADGAGIGPGSADDYLREMDIQAISLVDLPVAEQLLQRLSRKLAVKILRRRRSGPRSGPLDLRRSMRENMRFGGIIFNLKHKPKHRSRQQILLLCDVSASMKQYSTFVIHFLYGLREVVRDLSCLSFSDSLENLTPELKSKAGLQHMLNRVIRHSKNWGGGTNLGAALQELAAKYPDNLNAKTTIIVVSDTKTVALELALKELQNIKERVKRVIWLNPLPPDQWSDYRSIGLVAELTEMWPCSTIAQLEEVLTGRL